MKETEKYLHDGPSLQEMGGECLDRPFVFRRVVQPGTSKLGLPQKNQILGQGCRDVLDSIAFSDLEELETNLKSMLRHTKQMETALKKYQKIIQKWKDVLRSGQLDASPENLIMQEQNTLSCFMADMDSLFRVITKRPLSITETVPDYGRRIPLPLENDIVVVIENDCIFVKTPPLFNRNKHWFGKGQVDYFALFSQILEKKMSDKISELPRYIKKNVNGLFVYSAGNWDIPDADNVDTKKVVDAITRPLPGGDAGNTCSFSFASARSERLAPGAYFTVSKGFAVQPDFLENYLNLVQIFGV